jgi:methylated-DNA-[protein]-cysteine S-methyltransferase
MIKYSMNYTDIFPFGFDFTTENGALTGLRPAKERKLSDAINTKVLEEYFDGTRKDFSDVSVNPQGTDFQKRVWQELAKLRYGEIVTYEELAKRAGNEKAVRATASAVRNNPIPIIIPCHRVVRKDGSIGNYSMGGSDVKKLLLSLEGVQF